MGLPCQRDTPGRSAVLSCCVPAAVALPCTPGMPTSFPAASPPCRATISVQLLVLLGLALDIIYLAVLLVLRLVWGGSGAPSRECPWLGRGRRLWRLCCVRRGAAVQWGTCSCSRAAWGSLLVRSTCMHHTHPALPLAALPAVSAVPKFFVGGHPDTTSVSFIGGTIFTGARGFGGGLDGQQPRHYPAGLGLPAPTPPQLRRHHLPPLLQT